MLAGKQISSADRAVRPTGPTGNEHMARHTTSTLEALDVETAARLRTAIGRLSRRLRTTSSAREAGLSPTAVSVLLNIVRTGPTTLSELAVSEGINPTMLSRVVAGLVDANLLARSSDDTDRRVAWVTATDAGAELAQRIRHERTDAINLAMSALSQHQRRQIEKALDGLEALAEELGEHRP